MSSLGENCFHMSTLAALNSLNSPPLSSTLNKKSCRVTRLNNHTVERRKMKNELKRLQEHICKRDHDAHKEFSAKGMSNAQALLG